MLLFVLKNNTIHLMVKINSPIEAFINTIFFVFLFLNNLFLNLCVPTNIFKMLLKIVLTLLMKQKIATVRQPYFILANAWEVTKVSRVQLVCFYICFSITHDHITMFSLNYLFISISELVYTKYFLTFIYYC